jgi:bacterioferritin (cytochrome b1)
VNYQITSELEERLEMLDKYRQAFDVAREGLNESEFREDVIDSEQHIMKLEQRLKAIKDEGEISKATLKNAPAIIMDE